MKARIATLAEGNVPIRGRAPAESETVELQLGAGWRPIEFNSVGRQGHPVARGTTEALNRRHG